MADLSLSTWIWLAGTGVLSLLVFLVARYFFLKEDEHLIEWLKRHELLSGLCCFGSGPRRCRSSSYSR